MRNYGHEWRWDEREDADFKIPQHVVVSGRPLPRSPGGKLLEAQLRKSVEWGAPT
jgi:hypothetical protein